MAPTIVLKNGKPKYAVGSPGGATIITTVLQTLVNRIDFKHDPARGGRRAAGQLAQRDADPRRAGVRRRVRRGAGTRTTATRSTRSATCFTSQNQIGAVAALEFFRHGRVQAVAEPVRRGGGDARVVRPRQP